MKELEFYICNGLACVSLKDYNDVLEEKENIIKEAREYINSNEFIGRIRLSSDNKQAINKLLEILDKVEENK